MGAIRVSVKLNSYVSPLPIQLNKMARVLHRTLEHHWTLFAERVVYHTEVLTITTVELEGSFHLVSSAGLLCSCPSEMLWVEPLKNLVNQPIFSEMAMKEHRYLQSTDNVRTHRNGSYKLWESESMLKDGKQSSKLVNLVDRLSSKRYNCLKCPHPANQ